MSATVPAQTRSAQPEILAPAGNTDMLHAAVLAGADAVYLGLLQFNARRSAGNFSPEALAGAVRLCHARGVRVYVTLNTVLRPGEVAGAAEAVAAAADAGADALIVQDLAVAALAKRIAPALALHGSTQMSVHSPDGARMLASLGFSRVILARELTLGEIERITRSCAIETECFIHGALCMSVSGQCYMSAFLGGRSGNRGACAGPCRLPFDAAARRTASACHLSLKDLSALADLPALAAAGVSSFKIEGRLRSPEYAAAAVDAARRARAGQPYDEQLLRDVFSRSGFTNAYLHGTRGAEMFGVRTEADAAAARAAAPKLHALYRRETPRVGVSLSLALTQEGGVLCAADADGHTVSVRDPSPLAPGEKSEAQAAQSYRRMLEKTGGTPFYAVQTQVAGASWYMPAAAVQSLRRSALERLLSARAETPGRRTGEVGAALAALANAGTAAPPPGWAAHFEHVAAAPLDALAGAAAVSFPLAEWRAVPAALRAKTWLFAPRAVFGAAEDGVRRDAEACAGAGFAGFAAQNLAQFETLRGLPLVGAFGLNVTNPVAARALAARGARALTLSPELPLADLAETARAVPSLALAYGHMPLMLTRACPLHNVHGCAGCPGEGTLLDRRGMRFPVRCTGPAGARTVYNPVPLYWGDRPGALAGVMPLLYFTIESAARAKEVLALFAAHRAFDGPFTRGLYNKS